jgi:hypothetical protein
MVSALRLPFCCCRSRAFRRAFRVPRHFRADWLPRTSAPLLPGFILTQIFSSPPEHLNFTKASSQEILTAPRTAPYDGPTSWPHDLATEPHSQTGALRFLPARSGLANVSFFTP